MTVVGEPFVFITGVPEDGKCESLDVKKKKHVKCTGRVFEENSPDSTRTEHCCYGETSGVCCEINAEKRTQIREFK